MLQMLYFQVSYIIWVEYGKKGTMQIIQLIVKLVLKLI